MGKQYSIEEYQDKALMYYKQIMQDSNGVDESLRKAGSAAEFICFIAYSKTFKHTKRIKEISFVDSITALLNEVI